MKRIILSGCNGTMGKVVAKSVETREDCAIVGGFDRKSDCTNIFPVFTDFDKVDVECDVIIDFSHPSRIDALLDFAVKNKKPLVIATTGLSDIQIEKINTASKQVPVFFTANMSLGVNLLVELAKKATAVLGNQFDIEIIEKHHNKKIDAPSGTALMIADNISSVLSQKPEYVYDRQCKREKRSKNEIGLHSVRGGTIVGEHEVIFAGPDEILSITHTAMSKEIFATGAINAAIYICDKKQGLYSMKDLI